MRVWHDHQVVGEHEVERDQIRVREDGALVVQDGDQVHVYAEWDAVARAGVIHAGKIGTTCPECEGLAPAPAE